jgi:hypothetical protein
VRDKLSSGCGGYPQVADYNGDGINDIAMLGCDSNQTITTMGVEIIYGQPDGTFANPQFVTITTGSGSSIGLSYVLAGDYNRDRKPDLITLQPSNGVLHEEINTSSGSNFPKCVTLAKPYGINSCAPASGSTVVSPVNFSASALSLSPIRKMEVWVDGVKKVEKFNSYAVYSYLDQSVALGAGAHSVTLFAGGFDNRQQKNTFSFTVGGDCPALSSPGINICSPQPSATNPVQINATGRTANKAVWMELWVDGVKKFSVSGSQLVGNITLPVGSHTFAFFAIDSSGSKVSNQRVVKVR